MVRGYASITPGGHVMDTLVRPGVRSREAICQAAVGMLAQIGITVQLDAKPKAQHFPLINKLETDFYMLGWGVPTYDSEYIFNFLVHSKGEKYGSWNGTRFGR